MGKIASTIFNNYTEKCGAGRRGRERTSYISCNILETVLLLEDNCTLLL
jgi:hypothetical protein